MEVKAAYKVYEVKQVAHGKVKVRLMPEHDAAEKLGRSSIEFYCDPDDQPLVGGKVTLTFSW